MKNKTYLEKSIKYVEDWTKVSEEYKKVSNSWFYTIIFPVSIYKQFKLLNKMSKLTKEQNSLNEQYENNLNK
jgi:hypothetical protein